MAFLPDRSSLVARAYPFVEEIDDVPIADWLEASRRLVTRGSQQLVRREALRLLRRVNVVHRVMGREETEHVRLRLRAPDGARLDIALALSARYPIYGEWPCTTSRLLEGNVGYLRLASMDGDERALEALHAWMRRLAGTQGLVIDVRGNAGGSRALLRALFPYFLQDGEVRVVNARVGGSAGQELTASQTRTASARVDAGSFLPRFLLDDLLVFA